MQHIQNKNDWLSYEFKPYLFVIVGFASLISKKSLVLSTGQNLIAYICIALLFIAASRIFVLRADYRTRSSRK